MKINIDIDKRYKESSVTIQAPEITPELQEVLNVLQKSKQERIFGEKDDQTILLDPGAIDYVFAEKRKVFAVIKKERYEVKMKLYELEEMLLPHHFKRFSKSVIGNLNHIERFELSFNGNLCVYFHTGNKEYITRKYVADIKKALSLGGGEQ